MTSIIDAKGSGGKGLNFALLDLKVSIREGRDGHWGGLGISMVQVPETVPVILPVTEPV